MARRKNDNGAGVLTLVFIMAGTILPILWFFLLGVVTLIFYIYPFFVAAIYLANKNNPTHPPEAPDPAEFDTTEQERVIAGYLRKLHTFEDARKSYYAKGIEGGGYLTKGSNETRFDTRSKLGREINSILDELDRRIESLEFDIDRAKEIVRITMPLYWLDDVTLWSNKFAYNMALKNCLIVLLFATIIFSLLSINGMPEISYLKSALLWNPIPQIPVGPLVGGVLLSYVAFAVSIPIERKKLAGYVDQPPSEFWILYKARSQEWEYIARRWSVRSTFTIDGEFEQDNENQEYREINSLNEDKKWFDILCVHQNATHEEIRDAYRNAMKGCHPDKVAGLHPEIRKTAEETAKTVNNAYATARFERGFD